MLQQILLLPLIILFALDKGSREDSLRASVQQPSILLVYTISQYSLAEGDMSCSLRLLYCAAYTNKRFVASYPFTQRNLAPNSYLYQVVYIQEISFLLSYYLHIRSKNIYNIVSNYYLNPDVCILYLTTVSLSTRLSYTPFSNQYLLPLITRTLSFYYVYRSLPSC